MFATYNWSACVKPRMAGNRILSKTALWTAPVYHLVILAFYLPDPV